jgi:hypothetical protein
MKRRSAKGATRSGRLVTLNHRQDLADVLSVHPDAGRTWLFNSNFK